MVCDARQTLLLFAFRICSYHLMTANALRFFFHLLTSSTTAPVGVTNTKMRIRNVASVHRPFFLRTFSTLRTDPVARGGKAAETHQRLHRATPGQPRPPLTSFSNKKSTFQTKHVKVWEDGIADLRVACKSCYMRMHVHEMTHYGRHARGSANPRVKKWFTSNWKISITVARIDLGFSAFPFYFNPLSILTV